MSRRRAPILLLSLLLVATGNIFTRPAAEASTALGLRGHGWGHGRGMGQYGALGYAVDLSWSAASILDRFYGGTSAGTVATSTPMSVRLVAQDGLATAVVQERGHLFTSADDAVPGGRVAHSGIKVERVSANTYRIYDGSSCGGVWTPRAATVTGAVLIYPQVQNDDRAEMLQLCEASGSRWLRGTITATEDVTQRTVNTLDIENYLRGVVPRESPASWGDLGGGKGMQALQAQAVAARSYSYTENRYSYAKTCDTTTCQVYKGRAENVNGTVHDLEDTRSNNAIAQTAGVVRTSNSTGAVSHTEFSSSTGGYTAGGVFPAVADDGDDVSLNPNHTWETTIPASSIEAQYNKGTFLSATVTERNGLGEDGGRVLKMRLHFTGGDVEVTGDAFRIAFGLRSNWFTPTSGVSFHTYEPLGGSLASAPAAASWGGGRIDVFAQGPNNSFVHKWFDGTWRGFETLSGTITAAPAVSTWGQNHLDAFVRGTDNGLWHRAYDSGWAPDWTGLGGGLASAPASASWQPGRIDVFVRGTDNQLWHKWFDGGWSAWESLGGVITSAPAVTSWSPGRLDVFARGSDNALWHRYYQGGWSAWESLGGVLTAGPGAAAWAPGRLDVFVRGTDNALWQKFYEGGWSTYEGHGGVLAGEPGVSSWGPQRLDIFVRGTDNALWHAWEL
jgi:SpoIID/LytB domain protein